MNSRSRLPVLNSGLVGRGKKRRRFLDVAERFGDGPEHQHGRAQAQEHHQGPEKDDGVSGGCYNRGEKPVADDHGDQDQHQEKAQFKGQPGVTQGY